MVQANVERYGIPMFYINHAGAQTELIFDGGSIVMAPDGQLFDELPYFVEAIKIYDLNLVKKGGQNNPQAKDKIALIHDAIVLGVKDYFGKLGFTKAILGLSGGIDSAVTAALAARALSPENVRVVLMPSQFSSGHSIQDAQDLAENFGCPYDILPVQRVYESYMGELSPLFGDLPFNVTEENLQARIRGMYLIGPFQ